MFVLLVALALRAAALAPRPRRARPARDGAAPGLPHDLHEPARHDRLREPARRASPPDRARPGDLRPAALRLGRALHHAVTHRGDGVPLHELLLDRALDEPRAAAAATLGRLPHHDHRRHRLLLPRLRALRRLSGRAATARAGGRVHEEPARLSGRLLEAVGRRLLAAAGGQPRGVPLAARGGLAGGARVRLALRPRLVLDPAAVRARAVGLDDLPAAPLLRRPRRRLAAGAGRGRRGPARRPLVGAPAAGARLRSRPSGRAEDGAPGAASRALRGGRAADAGAVPARAVPRPRRGGRARRLPGAAGGRDALRRLRRQPAAAAVRVLRAQPGPVRGRPARRAPAHGARHPAADGARRKRLLPPRPAGARRRPAVPRLRRRLPRARHAFGLARGADAAPARLGARARARRRGRVPRVAADSRPAPSSAWVSCLRQQAVLTLPALALAAWRAEGAPAERSSARAVAACAARRARRRLRHAARRGGARVRRPRRRPRSGVLDARPQPRLRGQPDLARRGPGARRLVSRPVRARHGATLVGGVALAKPDRRAPRAGGCCIWLLLFSLPAVFVGFRFFPHYFVQLYLPLALLAAPWTAAALGPPLARAGAVRRRLGARHARRVHGRERRALLGPCARLRGDAAGLPRRRRDTLRADPCYGRGPLFVWGFAPQLYAEIGLPPASRFIVPQASLAGYVPGNRGSRSGGRGHARSRARGPLGPADGRPRAPAAGVRARHGSGRPPRLGPPSDGGLRPAGRVRPRELRRRRDRGRSAGCGAAGAVRLLPGGAS